MRLQVSCCCVLCWHMLDCLPFCNFLHYSSCPFLSPEYFAWDPDCSSAKCVRSSVPRILCPMSYYLCVYFSTYCLVLSVVSRYIVCERFVPVLTSCSHFFLFFPGGMTLTTLALLLFTLALALLLLATLRPTFWIRNLIKNYNIIIHVLGWIIKCCKHLLLLYSFHNYYITTLCCFRVYCMYSVLWYLHC